MLTVLVAKNAVVALLGSEKHLETNGSPLTPAYRRCRLPCKLQLDSSIDQTPSRKQPNKDCRCTPST